MYNVLLKYSSSLQCTATVQHTNTGCYAVHKQNALLQCNTSIQLNRGLQPNLYYSSTVLCLPYNTAVLLTWVKRWGTVQYGATAPSSFETTAQKLSNIKLLSKVTEPWQFVFVYLLT